MSNAAPWQWGSLAPATPTSPLTNMAEENNPTTDAPAAEEESGAHFEPVIKLEQTVQTSTGEVRAPSIP